jgi:hypothetical protein
MVSVTFRSCYVTLVTLEIFSLSLQSQCLSSGGKKLTLSWTHACKSEINNFCMFFCLKQTNKQTNKQTTSDTGYEWQFERYCEFQVWINLLKCEEGITLTLRNYNLLMRLIEIGNMDLSCVQKLYHSTCTTFFIIMITILARVWNIFHNIFGYYLLSLL